MRRDLRPMSWDGDVGAGVDLVEERSTASLNAFGASAMRPCAAPRNT